MSVHIVVRSGPDVEWAVKPGFDKDNNTFVTPRRFFDVAFGMLDI